MGDKEENLEEQSPSANSKSETKPFSCDGNESVTERGGELNLSEDESSDEELKPNSKPSPLRDNQNPIIPESRNIPNTAYDFTSIMKLQADLIEARERFNSCVTSFDFQQEEMSADVKNTNSSCLDNCSVEELLQLGEKKIGNDEFQKSELSEEVPNKCVEIVLPNTLEDRELRRQKNKELALTKHLNEVRNEHQRLLHKVHLLCLIAHGNYINSILNNEFLYGCALSCLPPEYSPPPLVTISYIQKLLKWFGNKFPHKKHKKTGNFNVEKLEEIFTTFKPCSVRDSVILFVSLLRGLSLTARVVINFNPLPVKVTKVAWAPNHPGVPCPSITGNLKLSADKTSIKVKKSDSKKERQGTVESNSLSRPGPSFMESSHELKKESVSASKTRKLTLGYAGPSKSQRGKQNELNDSILSEVGTSAGTTGPHSLESISPKSKVNMTKMGSSLGSSTEKMVVKGKSLALDATKDKIPRSKVLGVPLRKLEERGCYNRPSLTLNIHSSSSSEDEECEEIENKVKCGINYWAEVFIESEERWVAVDLFSLKVDCVREIVNRCTQPISYILGWKNDGTLKDVTRRYASTWTTKRYRIDDYWWTSSIHPFLCKNYELDIMEDDQLKELIEKAPLPTNFSEYKNHPLYVLQRHLLKYEAIYPQDAVPLGYVRGEPVFSRYCVQLLYSREKWRMQGKSVKLGELPYKVVKTRSKTDKCATGMGSDYKSLELFGSWQVVDYIPPPAVNGKVPKNQYGNVELYKPSMLPSGTVHIQVPGVLKIANKLNIDCAPAVTGWQHHNGVSHPVIDGVVVCKEYQDLLLDAWNMEMDQAEERSANKRKLRAKNNWLKICKSILIKEHLKKKYNFGKELEDDEPPPKLPKK